MKKSIWLFIIVIILLNCIMPTISIAMIDIVGEQKKTLLENLGNTNLVEAGSENTVDPTQWVAVDGLGRTLKTNAEVGNVKSDKEVGILFFLWHNTETVMYRRDREGMANAKTPEEKQNAFNTILHKEPINVQERLDAGASDNYNDPKWIQNNSDKKTNYGNRGYCWWNEPIYGYYKNDDKWVLRRQIELLADAGVDFLLLDYSNPSGAPDGPDKPSVGSRQPYWNNRFSYCWDYRPLFQALEEAKADGIKVPKVAFMLSFTYQDKYEHGSHEGRKGNNEMLLCLYENLYKDNKYSDLWYYRDGKPFIMSYKPNLTDVQNDSTVSSSDKAMLTTISSYFTFRNPGTTDDVRSILDNPAHVDGWLWQSAFPQSYGKSGEKVEEVPVSAAQNLGYISEPSSLGRNDTGSTTTGQANSNFTGNYTYKYRGKDVTVNESTQNALFYGRNFQQQWDRAISLDPEVIVITGWNEWVAVRRPANGENEKNYFMDEYNDERSKDIEPTKGKLKDYYYYQMVDNIRRFKGANKAPTQLKEKTIDINEKDISQWNDNNIISYNNYTKNDNSKDRVTYGWGYDTLPSTRIPFYMNKTAWYGNDLKKAKVSYDDEYVYFYLEVDGGFSEYYVINKTRLLIDTIDSKDSTSTANWEEFEFILNRYGATDNKLILEKSKGGWDWEPVGTVDYTKTNNVLQVKVPIRYLNLTGNTIHFNFKWVDNNITGVTKGDREGYPEDGDLKKELTVSDVTTGDIMSIYTDGDAAPGGRFAFSFTGQKTSYSISYNLNDGVQGSKHPTSAYYGDILTISNPTKKGYKFAGWTMTNGNVSTAKYGTTNSGVTTEWNPATTKVKAQYFKNLRDTNGTVTLVANWIEETAILKYDANGHGTAPANVTMKYSEKINAANEITAEGYMFKEWNTKPDGTGTSYKPETQIKAGNVVPTAMTLYAQWEEGYFKIKEYEQDEIYIYKIKPNTKRIDFENYIESNIDYSILENETEVEKEALIKTGQKIKAGNIEYLLIVSGDLNKDGIVSVSDLALIQRKILREEYELDDVMKKAADINDDDIISISDLASVKRFILKGEGL